MNSEERQRNIDVEHANRVEAGKPAKTDRDSTTKQRAADSGRAAHVQQGKPARGDST